VRKTLAALPLHGIVDLEAEKSRLAKEIAKLTGDAGKIEAKLNNADFVAARRKRSSRKTAKDWRKPFRAWKSLKRRAPGSAPMKHARPIRPLPRRWQPVPLYSFKNGTGTPNVCNRRIVLRSMTTAVPAIAAIRVIRPFAKEPMMSGAA